MKTLYLYIVLFFTSFCIRAQEQVSVYFETNKHELTTKEFKKLQQWILANPTSKIVAINGYTDEDGSIGYNDTLAKKRVDFVYNEIMDRVLIRADFKTRSYGKQHNHVVNKAENRRVTIYYILEKDLPNENKILGIEEENPVIEEDEVVDIKFPEKMIFENPNGSKTEVNLDIPFMKKLSNSKKGEKLNIENLNFVINTFAVAADSRGKLYELLLVMQHNSRLKIEIQGHLCCMPNDRLDLSTKRAKAIYSFLVANQIMPSRITYKGFGSSQPIYPIPEKNEAERAANRRVEILIVSNE